MKRYTFTLEETQEIKAARKKNRDKNVEKRLAALEMRAEGKQNKEIREKTGFHTQYITVLVSRYKANGLASITESHYHAPIPLFLHLNPDETAPRALPLLHNSGSGGFRDSGFL